VEFLDGEGEGDLEVGMGEMMIVLFA